MPDARQLVRQSIRNGERAWRQSFSYFCVKQDVDKQLDSTGHVRSVSDDVYDEIPLGYGSSYEELVRHDNEPVPKAAMEREQRELARLRALSPAEKQRRFQRLAADRSYMLEVPDAFDFKIVGEDNLPTGPAWVLDAEPHPGYQPKSRYGHMFYAMRGKLWIDKASVQWVKADAVAMEDVTFGFFIARLSKGSHIIIEQMRLPDGDWVPKRIEAKASARTFIFFTHNFEEDISYSDYRKANPLTASR